MWAAVSHAAIFAGWLAYLLCMMASSVVTTCIPCAINWPTVAVFSPLPHVSAMEKALVFNQNNTSHRILAAAEALGTGIWLFLTTDQVKSVVHEVKSVTGLMKSVRDITKSATDITVSGTEFIKSVTKIIKSVTDITKSATDITKSVTDITKSVTDITKSVTDITMSVANFLVNGTNCV
jgi:uncharacterized protein YoxC